MVTVRRLTLAMRSRIGSRIMRPGPRTPVQRPRKKITPLSYSWTTLTLRKKRMTTIGMRIARISIKVSSY